MHRLDDSKLFKELILHSFHDQHSYEYENKKIWHKDGLMHRTTGPAAIAEHITDNKTRKEKYSKKRGWYCEVYILDGKEVTPFQHYRESL